MQIAELFVNLGIKGADKTVGSLGNVEKGLKNIGSMSIEAKAGILGAMYALEKMFATSGAAGTNLTNFGALLGMSTDKLQIYQNAARQVGVSNDSMANTFKGLQAKITDTLLTGNAPKGFAMVQNATRDMGAMDLLSMQKDPAEMMKRLQVYAEREKNLGLRNEVLKSFGVGEDVIAGMARGGFNDQALGRAASMPRYNQGQQASLDKSNIAWANLGDKIEKSIGMFNAAHGQELVKNISMIADQILRLATAFEHFAEKIHLFEGIGKVFEGWAGIFNGISGAVDSVNKNKGGVGEGLLTEGNKVSTEVGEILKGAAMSLVGVLEPKVSAPASVTHKTEINNTITHHGDAKDTQGVKDAHNHASKQASKVYHQRAAVLRVK